MNLRKVYIAGFILTFSLFACEEELVIDSSNFETSLVVNSIFSPQSTWKIEISTSKNVLDPDSRVSSVEDATVMIYDVEGKLFVEFDHIINGHYLAQADKRANFGEIYHLVVNAPGFPEVTATSSVPKPVKIEDVVISEQNDVENPLTLKVDFKLIVVDDDKSNFFVWEVSKKSSVPSEAEIYDGEGPNNQILLSSTDVNTEPVAAEPTLQKRIFLTNKSFDQREYTTSFLAVNNQPPIVNEGDDGLLYEEINLRVMSVSQELYEYFRSIELYRLNNQTNSSVSQPARIFSNIENGLGIFAGYSEVIVELK